MSKSLLLKRFISSPKGVFGVLTCLDEPITLTAERPWLDNKSNESCIPDGTYLVKRVQSPKFGDTFEITGVSGRDSILFHSGNDPLIHSHGCILLGLQMEIQGPEWSVLTSKDAFKKFMDYMGSDQSFQLAIKWV